MKYELIQGSLNDLNNPIETVLKNRGIDDVKQYLSLKTASRETYQNLDYIQEAVELFDKHFQAKNPIGILMDNDVDGVESCTLMYKFIKALDSDYDVRLYVHERNKSHGLNDQDFVLDEDVKLLIVPDAGSNDLEEHIRLHENGTDCLCLDHHHVIIDIKDSPAIIVNNQSSKRYDNKHCCGTHITLEFCRALEEFYWTDICDDLLDLVAVANIADVMLISEFETRAIVNEGLVNIKNKMIQEIINAQSFSMKGRVNPHTVAFYIGPLINAFIRLATQEERMLLLKSFCEIEDEVFEYTKRGASEPVEENIYEHCVRLAKSYKSKQDRARDKAVQLLLDKAIQDTDNKVAIIDATEELDKSLTGLVAIKISEAINKPVLLLKEFEGDLSGSGRAFNNCPILDFRGLTEQCPAVNFASGHNSAFGVSLDSNKIDEAHKWFNEQLKDVSMEKTYFVDFIADVDDLNVDFIQIIDQHQDIWGRGVDEPITVIKNITIFRPDIHVQGKNFDSIAFMVGDIKFVMFKMAGSDPLLEWASAWDGDDGDYIVLDAIVEVALNEYKGVYTPQCMIKTYNITAQN